MLRIMSLLETSVTKKLIENNKYLFFFLPLIFFPIGFEYFEIPKYYFLAFFSFFYLLSLHFKDVKLVSVNSISLIFYLLITTLSSVQIYFKESFFGFDFLRYNSLFFLYLLLVFYFFYQQKKLPKNFINNIEGYFLTGIFICAVLGIIQFLVHPLKFISDSWYFDGRIVSTMGHPNFLASIMVIGLIISDRLKLIWVRLTLILCLILTFSKTSILIYFSYLYFLYIKNMYQVNRKISLTIGILSIILLAFVGAGLFSNSYKELIDNKPEMYQFQRFFVFLNPQELSLDLRFKIWNEAISAISDSPYFGFGKGQIIRIINMPEFGELFLSSTHNLYLDVAIESGLIGLSAFLIFIISSLINSYNFDRNLFLIQAFITIHGFFDITHVSLWFVFIFIAGISLNKYNKNYLKQL